MEQFKPYVVTLHILPNVFNRNLKRLIKLLPFNGRKMPYEDALHKWRCVIHVETDETVASFLFTLVGHNFQIVSFVAVFHLCIQRARLVLRLPDSCFDSLEVHFDKFRDLFYVYL